LSTEEETSVDKPVYEIPVIDFGGIPVPPPSSWPLGDFPPPGAPAFQPTEQPASSAAPLPAQAYPQPAAPMFRPRSARQYDEPSTGHQAEPLTDEQLGLLPPPAVSSSPAQSSTERTAADPDLIAALNEVLLQGASDLHLTTGAAPMIRIDGGLRPIEGAPIWSRDRVAHALLSILTPQQRETFESQLELDLAYTVSLNARFRVNLYQQRGAIGGAFRLIPTEIKELAALGIPAVVNRFATLPRGLVLVTGPTGSGKSTTLAALVDLVNSTRSDHIVTIEDPIEFLHTNKKSLVNQREVGSDTHSFANGLKHVLRQDPDVILIGELRDLETISVALTAAETGHLVFATLHTQSASQTIDRVIDVFPPHQQGQVRAQLAATLQGVVCQTLVKRATGGGRAVATEVMMATPAIANLIREAKTYQIPSAMQAGRGLGMHTMDQHLAELVNSGTITHSAALEKVSDQEGFKRLVSRGPSDAGSTGFGSRADQLRGEI
jgi:twitching motility protein PilT